MFDGISAYVSVASLVISLFSFGVSVFALRLNRMLAAHQRAATTFREYLQLELSSAKRGGESEADLKVAFLLLVAQEILNAFPGKNEWRGLLKDQLVYYAGDLKRWRGQSRSYVAHYGSNVEALVAEVIAEKEMKS